MRLEVPSHDLCKLRLLPAFLCCTFVDTNSSGVVDFRPSLQIRRIRKKTQKRKNRKREKQTKIRMSRDKISGKRQMRELLPRIIPSKIFLPWLVLDSRLAAPTRGNYDYKKREVRCRMDYRNCAPGQWRQWENIILDANTAESIVWDRIAGECAREC